MQCAGGWESSRAGHQGAWQGVVRLCPAATRRARRLPAGMRAACPGSLLHHDMIREMLQGCEARAAGAFSSSGRPAGLLCARQALQPLRRTRWTRRKGLHLQHVACLLRLLPPADVGATVVSAGGVCVSLAMVGGKVWPRSREVKGLDRRANQRWQCNDRTLTRVGRICNCAVWLPCRE